MNKILNWSQIDEMLSVHKNDKIVFTNGCFDIVHAGHVQYLSEAKELGDILIVGLNSDNSVRRLKGEMRPIVDEENRANVLLGLSSVDYVIIFDEDTPYKLIKKVNPNILVKGGDWAKKDIVGFDIVENNGGTVRSLSFKNGISSTKLIEKILKTYGVK